MSCMYQVEPKTWVSVLQVANGRYSFTFIPHNCTIHDKSNQIIRICEGESNLYKLGTLISSPIDASPCIDTITHDIPNRRSHGLWHERLGHNNVQKMKLMHQRIFFNLYFKYSPKFHFVQVMYTINKQDANFQNQGVKELTFY